MPKYVFRVIGDPLWKVPISRRLSNHAAAKCEAARTLGTMICDAGLRSYEAHNLGIIVADDTGVEVFTMQVLTTEANLDHDPEERRLVASS